MGFQTDLPELRRRSLRAQERFSRWLNKRTVNQLRKIHKLMFRLYPKLNTPLPKKGLPKDYLVRRCFMLYVLTHWHLASKNPWRTMFRKRAMAFLTTAPEEYLDPEVQALHAVEAEIPHYLSWDQIKRMQIEEIERFLVLVGLHRPRHRKRKAPELRLALWEIFFMPDPDDAKIDLVEIVVENPQMTYPQARAKYGHRYPNLTAARWKKARAFAKRRGLIHRAQVSPDIYRWQWVATR